MAIVRIVAVDRWLADRISLFGCWRLAGSWFSLPYFCFGFYNAVYRFQISFIDRVFAGCFLEEEDTVYSDHQIDRSSEEEIFVMKVTDFWRRRCQISEDISASVSSVRSEGRLKAAIRVSDKIGKVIDQICDHRSRDTFR